jgi:hypothetical protein
MSNGTGAAARRRRPQPRRRIAYSNRTDVGYLPARRLRHRGDRAGRHQLFAHNVRAGHRRASAADDHSPAPRAGGRRPPSFVPGRPAPAVPKAIPAGPTGDLHLPGITDGD